MSNSDTKATAIDVDSMDAEVPAPKKVNKVAKRGISGAAKLTGANKPAVAPTDPEVLANEVIAHEREQNGTLKQMVFRHAAHLKTPESLEAYRKALSKGGVKAPRIAEVCGTIALIHKFGADGKADGQKVQDLTLREARELASKLGIFGHGKRPRKVNGETALNMVIKVEKAAEVIGQALETNIEDAEVRKVLAEFHKDLKAAIAKASKGFEALFQQEAA